MNWTSIRKNWRTSVTGLIGFAMTVPGLIEGMRAWGAGTPINWRQLGMNIALTAISTGLVAAKDSSNHSTLMEVEQATVKDVQDIGHG